MRQLLLLTGVLLAGLAVADDTKGTKVTFGDYSSTTPAEWVKERPASTMRFGQFRLPKVKDDKDDAVIVLFKGITGTAEQNIERWKGEFTPPKGKSIDDVSKVTKMKIDGHPATRLEITDGTFSVSPRPFDPSAKKVAKPGYRMVGIQFDGPDTIYHIKMTGPAKTIEHYTKGFDKWIEGFKK